MLLVYSELKADVKILLNYIADCIETAVSIGIYLSGAVIVSNNRLCENAVYLLKVALRYSEIWMKIHIIVCKDTVYPLR